MKKIFAIGAIILSIVYLISPIDAIPDVPFIGYLDDATVIGIVIWGIKMLKPFKKEDTTTAKHEPDIEEEIRKQRKR